MKLVSSGILPMLLAVSQSSDASAAEPICYDAKIRAKPVAQIPTPYPSDRGTIVISWPWFVDLQVRRVLDGDVSQTKITALAVLHTAFVSKTRTWLLRRNTLGGFNILRVEEPESIPRCDAGIGAAEPYLRPTEGRSLEDYRRDGEEELRRYYTDDTE